MFIRAFGKRLHGIGWPAGLAALAVVVRIVYLATIARDPFFSFLPATPDADFFHNRALTMLAAGDWSGGGDAFFIGPLYTYFLAIIYALAGPQLWVVRGVHVLLDAATTALLFGIGGSWGGPRAARLAGFIWVFYLPAVFFAAQILPVTLGLFLIALALYSLSRSPLEHRHVVTAAFALGLFALDRPNVLAFVAVAALAMIFARPRLGISRVVVFAATVAAVVGGVTVRNYAVSGSPVVVSSQGGLNFYIGNSEVADGVYWDLGLYGEGRPEELNRDVATGLAEKAAGRALNAGEVSAWWAGQARDWITANPFAALRLTARKTMLLLNDREVSLNTDFYYYKFITPFHRLPIPWFGLLLPFGAAGAVWAWRNGGFGGRIGAFFVVAYGASVVAFFVSDRYRMPLAVPLAASAGAGVFYLLDVWRNGPRRRALVTTAAVVCLGAASIIPLPRTARDDFGYTYFKYGKYYFDQGDRDAAITYLNKAARSNPELYQAFILLAGAYELEGKGDLAFATLEAGLEGATEVPRMNFAYGMALINNNRFDEARPYLKKAVELDAGFAEGWSKLAMLEAQLGNNTDAADACRRYVELNENDAEAWLYLSGLEAVLGNAEAALTAGRRAASLNPELAGVNVNIGRLFAARGDFAAAGPYFEREMSLNPSPQTAGMLVLVYDTLGREADARAAYERYVSLGGVRDVELELKLGVAPARR